MDHPNSNSGWGMQRTMIRPDDLVRLEERSQRLAIVEAELATERVNHGMANSARDKAIAEAIAVEDLKKYELESMRQGHALELKLLADALNVLREEERNHADLVRRQQVRIRLLENQIDAQFIDPYSNTSTTNEAVRKIVEERNSAVEAIKSATLAQQETFRSMEEKRCADRNEFFNVQRKIREEYEERISKCTCGGAKVAF